MANNYLPASQLSTTVYAIRNARTGFRGLSFWAPMFGRTVLVTWRSPRREDIHPFFVLNIWTAAGGDPYLSKPNELKFNRQVLLGNYPDEIYKFHCHWCSFSPCVDRHTQHYFEMFGECTFLFFYREFKTVDMFDSSYRFIRFLYGFNCARDRDFSVKVKMKIPIMKLSI